MVQLIRFMSDQPVDILVTRFCPVRSDLSSTFCSFKHSAENNNKLKIDLEIDLIKIFQPDL